MLYSIDPHHTLDDLLSVISKNREVFALKQDNDSYHLVNAGTWDKTQYTLGDFRPVEPLKALVFKPRESLGALFSTEKKEVPERIVFGVKNCDLSALQIHDYVFASEPVDEHYKELRDKTIIVSCDCTRSCAVCFCPIVDEQPYALKGFDINISVTKIGTLVESGSARGEKVLQEAAALLEKTTDTIIKERDRARASLTQQIIDQCKPFGLEPGMDLCGAIKKSNEAAWWDEFAKDCVECGACNFSCCTCHCFLLADGKNDGVAGRIKQWDACLYLNFARVAGNGNPRKHRSERLHNRFDKKFNFFPTVLKTIACDGCGRCAQACTGKIDIRKVLKRAVDEARRV